jgi:hypothetical protein
MVHFTHGGQAAQYILKNKQKFVKPHQGEAAEKDHSDDGSLEVLVLHEAEGLDAEGGPALPEGRVLLPRHAGEVDVAADGAAVRRVLGHQQLLGVSVQHQLSVQLQL